MSCVSLQNSCATVYYALEHLLLDGPKSEAHGLLSEENYADEMKKKSWACWNCQYNWAGQNKLVKTSSCKPPVAQDNTEDHDSSIPFHGQVHPKQIYM